MCMNYQGEKHAFTAIVEHSTGASVELIITIPDDGSDFKTIDLALIQENAHRNAALSLLELLKYSTITSLCKGGCA